MATFQFAVQRQFARRIHVLLPVEDKKLPGVVLLRKGQAVDFDPVAGRCRVLPKEAGVRSVWITRALGVLRVEVPGGDGASVCLKSSNQQYFS